MKRNYISIIGIILLVIALTITLTACGNDDTNKTKPGQKDEVSRVVRIFSHTGNCKVTRDSKELNVTDNMLLKSEDLLNVSKDSNAVLKLDNDKFVMVKENTGIKMVATGTEKNTKTRLHVLDGGIIVEVKDKLQADETFEIASSNSVMAIRGTQISFDVTLTEDSITSTFSILTGKTEIFLYRDETMNSTELIKDWMMSYTTSLIKSTDEIYQIYDSYEAKKISDEELETIYKTKKTPISRNKINEMVEVVNEFEKIEDELVNGTINLDTPNTVTYGVDPKSLISVLDDNKYIDFDDLEFNYSKEIDGTYSPFDNTKPLNVGEWYVKVKALNAYESEPFKFTVLPLTINFEIENVIKYKVDPINGITLKSNVDDVIFGYSTTSNGIFNEFDSVNALFPGTYYVKVINSNYTSEAKMFSITNANLQISLRTTSITYKTNPTNNVTIVDNAGQSNVKIVFSQDIDGQYSAYQTNSPLAVGTWYVKAKSGDYFESEALEFMVTPANISYTVGSEVAYGVDPSTIVTVSGTYPTITYLYSDSETGEFNEFDSDEPLTIGTWYIKLDNGSNYTSAVKSFEVTQKEITYTISSEVGFNVDPKDNVTITNGTYPNVTYLYSNSINGEFNEFDSDEPLTIGTWYIKLDNGSNYTSAVKSFDIVPAKINYSLTSTSVEYGVNPSTIVMVYGSYNGTIKYLYSAREDGTYSEYDSSNPLSFGTYYIKLAINDNYYSVATRFNVTKKTMNFTISSEINYGENIINEIIVTGTYSSISYYYSTNSDFTNPSALTAQTILDPGTYYVRLSSGTNYESAIESFVITAIEIDYTVPSEISYGTDPSRAIRINGTYPTITYTYSQSATGTFREYSDNNRLTIGTWYVKLTINDCYTAEIKPFDVVKAIQAFELSSTSIPYGDDLSNYITDSLNRNIMISTNGTTYSLYDPADELSVGTYYIKLENDYYTSNPREITITERQFTVSNITMNDNYITATIKTLETTGSKTFKVTYYVDSEDALTTELFDDGDRYYFQVMNLTDSSIVEFKYLYYIDDVLTDETDYYIIDTSNLEDLSLGTDFELTESRSAFALHTFNSDGTINLYYDLGFVNNTSYDLVCEVTYGTYSFGEVDVYYSNQKKVFTTSEFLTLTDLAYRSWAVCGIRVLKLVDGIYYVAYSDYDDEDYDNDLCRPLFDAKAAANGIYYDYDEYFYEISASFNTVLEVDGIATVTVKVTDDNWDEVIQTITFTSDDPTRVVNVSCDDLDELYVTISYTRVISIKSDLAQKIFDSSHTSDMKINNASQLEEVSEAMEEKFGITIKGTFSRDYNLETYFEPDQW